jgi:signal transduction histidine kinase
MSQKKGRWPFYPQHLTDILDPAVARLLLAGLSRQLDAPIGLCEMRDGEPSVVPQHGILEVYPRLCKELLPEYPHPHPIETNGCHPAIVPCEHPCAMDQRIRLAEIWQNAAPFRLLESMCHLGLSVLYVPIQVGKVTVAFAISGCFARDGNKEEIARRLKDAALPEQIKARGTDLLSDLPAKDGSQIDQFKEHFLEEVSAFNKTLLRFYELRLREKEVFLRARISSRMNKMAESRGTAIAETWARIRNETQKILREICDFLGAEFVALFSGERLGDVVLPLLAQCGIDSETATKAHFNWRKAGLSTMEHFDSNSWLKAHLQEDDFPYSFLAGGLKMPLLPDGRQDQAWDQFSRASFILPYLYGYGENQYRGLFVIGPLGTESARDHEDFLSETGHLVLSRVLALLAIEVLNRRDYRRETMAKLWAHDVRAEIHSMMGWNHAIRKQLAPNRKAPADPNTIENALQRMGEILEKMSVSLERTMHAAPSSFSSLVDRTALKKEPHLLSTVIYNCISKISHLAVAKRINVQLDPSIDVLPAGNVDRPYLDLVFTNILENAVKYSYDGSTMRVWASSPDSFRQWALIHIENIGIGIPKEDLSRIFEFGYRSATASAYPGGGIGLYSAKNFVNIHGGDIWAESSPVSDRLARDGRYETTLVVKLPTFYASK